MIRLNPLAIQETTRSYVTYNYVILVIHSDLKKTYRFANYIIQNVEYMKITASMFLKKKHCSGSIETRRLS